MRTKADRQREYAASPKGRATWLRRYLRTNYGITPEVYDAMLAAQNGVCAICRQRCPTRRRLAVDHDHQTGKVRGLLCANCNQALGKLKDSPLLVRAAADYLERR